MLAETTGASPLSVVTKEDFILKVDEWYTEVTTDDILLFSTERIPQPQVTATQVCTQ